MKYSIYYKQILSLLIIIFLVTDNNKLDNQNNSNADISDGEPNEDIQTVICDVKRYKRKKKVNFYYFSGNH